MQKDTETGLAGDIFGSLALGYTLGDIANIGKDKIEGLYLLAYKLYNAGNYEDAETVFRMLCIYKHNEYRFLMGLAGSLQGRKAFREAAEFYGMAGLFSQLNNPEPFWYASQCFLKINEKENAIASLEGAMLMGKDNPDAAAFHTKAKNLLEFLQKNDRGGSNGQ